MVQCKGHRCWPERRVRAVTTCVEHCQSKALLLTQLTTERRLVNREKGCRAEGKVFDADMNVQGGLRRKETR